MIEATFLGVRVERARILIERPGVFYPSELSDWMERVGGPPDSPVGWGADPPPVIGATACALLSYMGVGGDDNRIMGGWLATELLRYWPHHGWQIGAAQILTWLKARELFHNRLEVIRSHLYGVPSDN